MMKKMILHISDSKLKFKNMRSLQFHLNSREHFLSNDFHGKAFIFREIRPLLALSSMKLRHDCGMVEKRCFLMSCDVVNPSWTTRILIIWYFYENVQFEKACLSFYVIANLFDKEIKFSVYWLFRYQIVYIKTMKFNDCNL